MALVAGLVRSVSKTARFTVRLLIIHSSSVKSDAIFNIETKNEKKMVPYQVTTWRISVILSE